MFRNPEQREEIKELDLRVVFDKDDSDIEA